MALASLVPNLQLGALRSCEICWLQMSSARLHPALAPEKHVLNSEWFGVVTRFQRLPLRLPDDLQPRLQHAKRFPEDLAKPMHPIGPFPILLQSQQQPEISMAQIRSTHLSVAPMHHFHFAHFQESVSDFAFAHFCQEKRAALVAKVESSGFAKAVQKSQRSLPLSAAEGRKLYVWLHAA